MRVTNELGGRVVGCGDRCLPNSLMALSGVGASVSLPPPRRRSSSSNAPRAASQVDIGLGKSAAGCPGSIGDPSACPASSLNTPPISFIANPSSPHEPSGSGRSHSRCVGSRGRERDQSSPRCASVRLRGRCYRLGDLGAQDDQCNATKVARRPHRPTVSVACGLINEACRQWSIGGGDDRQSVCPTPSPSHGP
jgi:hypothetical protein